MRKEFTLTKQILNYLLTAGLIAITSTSPYFAQSLIKSLKQYWKKEKFEKRKLSQALKRLESQKLIGISQKGDKTIITLTQKGEIKALKYKFDEMKIKKPKNWDGKWRIVIFDIPDKKKLARDVLRRKFKELGLIMIQKSVFVHPYPCEEEIEFVKEIYGVGPYIKIIQAETFDGEQEIKKIFNIEI